MQRVLWVGLFALVFAGQARADGPRYEPPFSWTGFYLGVNAGQAWRNATTPLASDDALIEAVLLANLPTPQPFDVSGFVGGGQVGHNWRIGARWVAGFEADFQYSTAEGGAFSAGAPLLTMNTAQELKWFGTLRGRLGFQATDRLLVFGTGGLAFGHTEASASVSNLSGNAIGFMGQTQINCPAQQLCLADTASRISAGSTFGGGVEYALSSHVTFKAEYLYVDLGDQTLRLLTQPPASGDGSVIARFDNAFSIVRAGLNFKF